MRGPCSHASTLRAPRREVPQGARGKGEVANVQVLEGHKERMQAVQDVGLRRDRSLVVVLDHLEQIGGLAEARGLDQAIAARAHLGHLIIADGAVHHVVAVDPLHELAMGLPHIGEDDVWVSRDERLPEFSVVFTCHFSSPSGCMVLKGC